MSTTDTRGAGRAAALQLTPTLRTDTGERLSPELTEGLRAPDFRLPSARGGEVALSDFGRRLHVVLFFVREFV